MISKADVKRKFHEGEYSKGFIYSEGLAASLVILEVSHGIEDHVCGFVVVGEDRRKTFFRRKVEDTPNGSAFFRYYNRNYNLNEFIEIAI